MGSNGSILIIGTGLAGSIAYHALRAFKPTCLDRRPEPEEGMLGLHPAVMRLRDRQVADIIGAKFREVRISKAIFMDDRLYTVSDIRLNNLYSRKVYGALGRRSLNSLEEETRYIMPEGYPAPESTLWGRSVAEIEPGVVYVNTPEGKTEKHKYRHLISTIPMEHLIAKLKYPGGFTELEFEFTPIKVLHIKLKIPSSVNQTIYFPSPMTSVYRITIQSQDVIIESIEETGDWVALLQRAFGLDSYDFDYDATRMDDWKTMPIGKISPMNENHRLRCIMWLTDEYNIFSFGRFSVWKPLRTDHLLGDIEKIRRIISATDTESKYKGRL